MVGQGVHFAAFTGRAAHVLAKKGCVGAVTIHSLIYIPKSKSAARLRELQKELVTKKDEGFSELYLKQIRKAIKEEQDNVKRPMFALNEESILKSAKLLIVDEVSMINKQMGEDLLSFDIPILVLGDPAQLPPVKGGGYFTDVKPDVMLTEIHRQAEGSPILSAATAVREGRGLIGCPLVVPKGQLDIADLAKFDQVLVGTNRSRHHVNAKMRKHQGRSSELPEVGDRLICTRNDGETGLLNGSQWVVRHSVQDPNTDRLLLRINSVDGDEQLTVTAHHEPFQGKEIPYYQMRDAQCFEYAYAITTHKAQGGQYESVCVIDESNKFPGHMRSRWLYTAITRASEELVIIR